MDNMYNEYALLDDSPCQLFTVLSNHIYLGSWMRFVKS